MTSPPERVASADQIGNEIESLMNLTDPSVMAELTPPGWRLRAE